MKPLWSVQVIVQVRADTAEGARERAVQLLDRSAFRHGYVSATKEMVHVTSLALQIQEGTS